MGKYIVKRLLISVCILFFASFIIYAILRFLPTSYVEKKALELSQKGAAKSYSEWLVQLNATYGLDSGILQGFFTWLGSAIKGDFGESWYYSVPVIDKFKSVIGDSVAVSGISLILQVGIAVPLGIKAAKNQYSKTDYTVTAFTLLGISLPSFFFGSILKLIFSVKLGWVDLYGKVGRYYNQLNSLGKFLDVASHLILPVATLTMINIGSLMRYTRTNMLEVLNADYVRTARAKGLPEKKVINSHAFRNTLIPIITILGMEIPALFTGALITETIFQIPGIGYTGYLAMTNGDIPFCMFYLVFTAVMTLLGTLIADILYAVADPRIRIS